MEDNQKTATLKITLNSDNGYESKEEHRIDPSQWEAIQRILHNNPKKKQCMSCEKTIEKDEAIVLCGECGR